MTRGAGVTRGAGTVGGLTGGLALEVVISGGVVRAVALRSDRPVALCRAMVGRRADDVPAAFERLYALCGRSHRIAAHFALDAARGREIPASVRRAAVYDLAAERVGEHLRSTLASAASLSLPAETAELEALRAAFAAARPGAHPVAMAAPLAVLGLDRAPPAAESWAGRMLNAVGPEAAGAGGVDALTEADDAAVLAALARWGVDYAALPHLPLRRPETGALARARGNDAPRDRLAARFAEISHAAALLREQAEATPSAWFASFALPDGTGFAAVETPRGRMHHLAAVDAQDRVAVCAVLAPTEWNFHPDGPLVHALPGLRLGSGEAAARRLRCLVALFDPCVSCTLDLREDGNA